MRRTAERGPRGNIWQRLGGKHKDSALLAVNGVSVLTYEFFCKTAPSDSLSMRRGLGEKRENAARRVRESRRQSSDVFTVKTDCKSVFPALCSRLYMLSSCCYETSGGRDLQLSVKSGAVLCIVVAQPRDPDRSLSAGDVELQSGAYLNSIIVKGRPR